VHQFGLNYTSKSVRYECQRLPLTAISLRFIVDSHGLRKQELVGVHKKERNIYTYTHDAFLRNWTSAVADSCINLVRAGFPSKGPAVHKIFNGTCPHNAAVQLLLGTWTWFKILWTDQWPSISSFVGRFLGTYVPTSQGVESGPAYVWWKSPRCVFWVPMFFFFFF
jgi:hypothetical protein